MASRCLHIVPDPSATDLQPYRGLADAADLPILVAALREGCPWLVTCNVGQTQPGHPGVTVLRPGEFLLRVRDRLARLTAEGKSRPDGA
jgi:hypothetical protein